jgi:glycosyltransferase involved in cell wall biosynthesis
MSRNKRLFFIYLAPEEMVEFVKKDYKILADQFDVNKYCYRGWKRGFLDLPSLFYGILRSEVNVSWFAYTQAYYAVKISKVLKKRSIVIVGGFDVAEEENPEKTISYKRQKQLNYTLDNADLLISISQCLRDKVSKYSSRKDIKLIYHAFDYNYFKPGSLKENIVITTGYVKKENLWRKGHETFVRSAKYLPDVKFILVGKHLDDSIEYLKSIAAPNVEFTGWVSDEKLLEYMQRAKVYVQVSYHEGFGLSLAEAMLCECTPIVTERGAIPEVVGDSGYYVPFDDPQMTAEAIQKACNSSTGEKARDRIKLLYPLEKRKRDLVDAVEDQLK